MVQALVVNTGGCSTAYSEAVPLCIILFRLEDESPGDTSHDDASPRFVLVCELMTAKIAIVNQLHRQL